MFLSLSRVAGTIVERSSSVRVIALSNLSQFPPLLMHVELTSCDADHQDVGGVAPEVDLRDCILHSPRKGNNFFKKRFLSLLQASFNNFTVYIVCANSVVNPFVYVIQYHEFQQRMKEIFCSKRYSSEYETNTATTTTLN